MAHKTLIVCDYDQTHEATEEVTVALDGAAVLLDLCEDDAATVRETVQDIIDRGRPIALKDMGKRGNGGTGEVDPAVVRSWALANGITVSDRGRAWADTGKTPRRSQRSPRKGARRWGKPPLF